MPPKSNPCNEKEIAKKLFPIWPTNQGKLSYMQTNTKETKTVSKPISYTSDLLNYPDPRLTR